MDLILPCIWFFILGTALGSFYNVLVDRLPEGRDFVFERSVCSDCGTKLKWYDLIPIFSFLFIGGKCRYCGAKLSAWYLVSEITVGLLGVYAFLRYASVGSVSALIGSMILWSLLFIVAVMDWKTGMIMDVFPLIIAVTGVVFGLIDGRGIFDILLGGVVGGACFGLLYLAAKLILRREGLGLGDVFLLGGIGFWMPWQMSIITAFLTAYVSLAFILIKALKEKKIGMKTEFPLGPSICIAAFIMNICGERILEFITGIILP